MWKPCFQSFTSKPYVLIWYINYSKTSKIRPMCKCVHTWVYIYTGSLSEVIIISLAARFYVSFWKHRILKCTQPETPTIPEDDGLQLHFQCYLLPPAFPHLPPIFSGKKRYRTEEWGQSSMIICIKNKHKKPTCYNFSEIWKVMKMYHNVMIYSLWH